MNLMKFLICLAILLVLNACREKNIPIKNVDSKSTTKKDHSQSSIKRKPRKKLNIIVTDKKKSISSKKNTQSHKNKTSTKKKKNTNHLKHIPVTTEPEIPYVNELPTLPNLDTNTIKSIEKSKQQNIDNMIATKVTQHRESFSGGDILDTLDMATIRVGKSSDYTSIIFDSYVYEGANTFPSHKSSASGIYLFTYEPSKKRIVGLIDGYNAFSALLTNQRELFSDSKIVENIYILKHLGNDGIKFAIKLRKNVRVNIFDVKNPGRIIVNLFPL